VASRSPIKSTKTAAGFIAGEAIASVDSMNKVSSVDLWHT
jgi:hypothetical protein